MSPLFGVIEGFYGRQWRWHQRRELVDLLPDFNCNAYLYAPKGDAFLRRRWREHWPESDWHSLMSVARAARCNGISFGVGLSVLDYSSDDKYLLAEKLDRLNELQLGHLGVFFDDMRGDDPGLLDRQLAALAWIRQHSNVETILFCPTYYSTDPILEEVFGERPSDYWTKLALNLPFAVQCFWTGSKVCSQSLDPNDAVEAMRVFKRKPAFWDNYPVNDGRLTSRYLHLRPLQRRQLTATSYQSYFMNPMNQFELSLPVIASAHLAVAGSKLAQQEAYCFAEQRWGRAFADFWWENTDLVQSQGLDGMSEEQRQSMRQALESFDNPAAKEWLDWLHGGYTFDPACLTS